MAYSFTDAGNKYLLASSTPITAAPLTLSAWIYPTSISGDNDHNICQIQDSTQTDEYFRFSLAGADSATAGSVMFAVNNTTGGYRIATTTTGCSDNTWHHYAARANSSSSRDVYLDGGGKGSNTDVCTPEGLDTITISREGDSTPGDEWDGNLAEIGIWDVDLTEAEIAWLATGASPLTLTHRLGNLKVYQPLIRELNQYGIGPSFSAFNSPGVVAHPRIFYPKSQILQFPPAAVVGGVTPNNLTLLGVG